MKISWLNRKSIPLLSPLEGYERWASSYSLESNPIKKLSNEAIQKFLPDLRGKSVLDAGCGTGYFCQIAHAAGASSIAGWDIPPLMLEQAKIQCPSANFLCADISREEIPKDNFDVIILALVLGHIENIGPVLANLSSALRPGGTLILSDFHPVLTLGNAKRTFKDQSGNLFEIQHHLHLVQEIIENLHQHQVMMVMLEEPLWNDRPAIYAIQAKKKE